MKYKKTSSEKKKYYLAALFFVFAFLIAGLASGQSVNYCCEKTKSGAWCQNAPQEKCDSGFKIAPTSCDSTSYCKPGCCFDSIEGLCMENTPQIVCEANKGTWANDSKCDVPYCQLGCCILGDQGAFVTLTRCKQISGFFGLTTDFRKNIGNELTCIATAQAEDMGACVYDNPQLLRKECIFTTRSNCKGASLANVNETNATAIGTGEKKFYKDILCSAEELGTLCAPTTETITISGKDEVYFKDTCGNPANIYDSSKYDDKQYWKKVFKKSESCGYGNSNANSKTCGNCDYYLGSIAKPATRTTGFPSYGNYICMDLSCKKEEKKHGESWCVKDSPTGNGSDPVGSRYFKEVCLNGEVITEPCAEFRNEICIEGQFGTFTEAACRPNRWQLCLSQIEKGDCENTDQRDCMWIPGYYYSESTKQIEKSNNDSKKGAITPDGICLPYYPPGQVFWSDGQFSGTSQVSTGARTPAFNATTPAFGTGYVNPASASGSSSSTQCASGNARLTVKWEKTEMPLKFLDDDKKEGTWSCKENCQYWDKTSLPGKETPVLNAEAVERWAQEMNVMCYALGDCGGYINYLGQYTDEGYAAYQNGRRVAGSGGAEIMEQNKPASSQTGTPQTSGVQGSMIVDFIKNIAGGK